MPRCLCFLFWLRDSSQQKLSAVSVFSLTLSVLYNVSNLKPRWTCHPAGLKPALRLIPVVWPDHRAGPALARPAAGHSCQTDQQDLSLRRTSSCLLRILEFVISGEVLSSQLASLPPLMEGRQRQGKYNYWSERETLEPAEVPRFTAGTRHQSLPRYGDHNPVTAPLLLSWASGRVSVVKCIGRTNWAVWSVLLPSEMGGK